MPQTSEREEAELEGELQALVNACGEGSATRGVGLGLRGPLIAWCTRAVGRLVCRTGGGHPRLTEWGGRMLRTLFLVLVENHALWSGELCDWLDEHVLPCLFSGPESRSQTHDSLSYELMRGLMMAVRTHDGA